MKENVLAGLIFLGVGVAGLVAGRGLNIGTAAEMGEGYFPLLMCWLLVGLGAIITMTGIFGRGERAHGFAWKPVGFVSAAVIGFALALETLGVVAAIIAAVVLSSRAGAPMRTRQVALLAAVLSIAVLAIFVWGLGLPLRALPKGW